MKNNRRRKWLTENGAKKAAAKAAAQRFLIKSHDHFVENLNTVVVRYSSPGFKIVVGKFF